ncbi:MAG: hypothetical protein RLZ98_3292 [Pseudomonadota bacterium]|jgi:hypothetical protein
MADIREKGADRVGRVIDYIFGRNALIGIASLMLLAISGFATWSGMSDFIIGVSQTPGSVGRPIAGLSVTNEMLVIAIVIALTFLMWLALRETFGAQRSLRDRLITFPLYLFLFLWSVGFGYGFWWSLIAGEEATRSSLSNLQEDARDASSAIAARLDAVKIQLDSVVAWSESQMAREEGSGGSCGLASGAGRGPLYNARKSVRDAVASLRDNISKSWLGPVQADIEALKKSASGPEGVTVEERQKTFEALAGNIRARARSIAARSNELGKSTAAEMKSLAAVVSIQPGKAGFSCFDPTLAQRLNQAAAQADEPAVLRLREATFNEGPAGVANAVKRMWANMGTYIAYPFQFVLTAGNVPVDPNAETITGRDLIALLATIGVDLGLFALTALNPPNTPPPRPVSDTYKRRIRDAINVTIQRAPGTDLEWVHRHLVHHNEKSYFVIPNLYLTGEIPDAIKDGLAGETDDDKWEALKKQNEALAGDLKNEKLRGLAMNQLAGVLFDLKLIRPLKEKELDAFAKEELRRSKSDLDPLRHRSGESGANAEGVKALRNHGLLSKARRSLDTAGWSQDARRDAEIFELLDAGGITPLLSVLNEESERELNGDETRRKYLDALIEATKTNAGPQPAILRLSKDYRSVKQAVNDLIERRSEFRQDITLIRARVGDEMRARDDELTAEWIKERGTVYRMSELHTAEIQSGLELFHELESVARNLGDSAGDQQAKARILSFLHSASEAGPGDVVAALEGVGASRT